METSKFLEAMTDRNLDKKTMDGELKVLVLAI